MLAIPPSLPSAFTLAQARAEGLSKKRVYTLLESGQLALVSRGVYRRADASPESEHELVEIALRAPDATLCLETALARHGLSDTLITAPDLALRRGTRPPTALSPVRWHFFQTETFELGRELIELDRGIVIGLYSAERSIVDAFRLRGREGRDVANEALRRWIRRRGAEPGRLVMLANQLPRASTALRQALEVLL